MTRLFPCPTCQRHVRDGDRCPFCGAALFAVHTAPADPKPGVRRALMLAAALTTGATVDCDSTVETQQTSTGSYDGTGGTTASTSSSATTSTSTAQTGGAGGSSSSSSSSSTSSTGTGGFYPPYGAPPI